MPVHLLLRRLRTLARRGASGKVGKRARHEAPAATGGAVPDGPEPTRHAIGTSHSIRVPAPATTSDHLLVLRVEPSAPYCHLAIDVNGTRQRALLLHMRAVVCCHLTRALLAGAPDLEVSLDTSGSLDVEDGSVLSVLDASLVKFTPPGAALRPSLDLAVDPSPPALGAPASDAELLSHFLSFGDNCEFGLYQRRHGFDGASFLRLAAVPFDGLALGLEERFAACYEPGELFFEILKYPDGKREYILKHQRYEIFWHTLVDETQVPAAKMLVREYQKLCMLLRMLVESLAEGNKIIVYRSEAALEIEACERLARLLAPYGRNGLLVVAPARRKDEIGKVVVAESGLMLGYIDKFLPHDATNLRASNVWMTICRNAFECWRRQAATRSPEASASLPADPP